MAAATAVGSGPVRKRVVILGGGFGGINAVTGLAHLPVDVTLVDRRNHYLFQPLLYQVALAVLSPADIAMPVRSILADQKNVRVLLEDALRIDAKNKIVVTENEEIA